MSFDCCQGQSVGLDTLLCSSQCQLRKPNIVVDTQGKALINGLRSPYYPLAQS